MSLTLEQMAVLSDEDRARAKPLSSAFRAEPSAARMESKAALGERCRRAPGGRLEADGTVWSNSFFRVPDLLPVGFH